MVQNLPSFVLLGRGEMFFLICVSVSENVMLWTVGSRGTTPDGLSWSFQDWSLTVLALRVLLQLPFSLELMTVLWKVQQPFLFFSCDLFSKDSLTVWQKRQNITRTSSASGSSWTSCPLYIFTVHCFQSSHLHLSHAALSISLCLTKF